MWAILGGMWGYWGDMLFVLRCLFCMCVRVCVCAPRTPPHHTHTQQGDTHSRESQRIANYK